MTENGRAPAAVRANLPASMPAAKKKTLPRPGPVTAFLEDLVHPLRATVAEARGAILASNAAIEERIKWNAPSFCWAGDDRVTMNLRGGTLMFVFHRGAKKKDATGFTFADPTRPVG